MHLAPLMLRAEHAASQGVGPALRELRQMCLTDFGHRLLYLPDAKVPGLSSILPGMMPADRAAYWTGGGGHDQLLDSLSFVRILAQGYHDHTGKTLHDKRILDFGCGFGRLLRMMLYYTDPANLAGVDPWEGSLEACKEFNVLGDIRQSDYLPTSLPVTGKFDAIYSYSVLTHTSRRATLAALAVLRDVIADNGLLTITIRPVEFWHVWGPTNGLPNDKIARLQRQHFDEGFAFDPIDLPPIDGDITFGTTSMNLEWIEATAPGWRFVGYDRGIEAFQQIIFLKPV